ncbi:MAG: nucleotide sugar dehydrogenase [Cyanobacteria bacterium HKST-UBA04]|nr:nucleotide sugar dehydrogenase [Cyanobacteria bacterium HKST-UBA04]
MSVSTQTTASSAAKTFAPAKVARVCVMGLGYVGLPTALLYAQQGLEVQGVDINPQRLEALKSGHLPEGFAEYQDWWQALKTTMPANQPIFEVGDTPAPADAFIIAVPTPFDDTTKHCDLSAVESAVRAILPVLAEGNLVVLESTVPPGTTRRHILPLIESTGLVVGESVFLCFCPERVLPGNTQAEMINNDRLVGGVTTTCARLGHQLLSRVVVGGDVFMTDDATAEFCKLAENTYRDVNIALANELAKVAEQVGINMHEALPLINRHPRVNLHRPGIGVGGHCIAVDPWFMVEAAPEQTPLIRLARTINDQQPMHIVGQLTALLAQSGQASPKLVVVGLTYKPNVADTRQSPAFEIFETFKAQGLEVLAYDPLLTDYNQVPLETLAQGADCLAVLVNHTDVQTLLSEQRQVLMSVMRTPHIVVY